MLDRLLRPPLRLLDQFGVPLKFGILTFMFFLSGILPTLFMLKGQNRELAHLQVEHEGTIFLKQLHALGMNVARHRMEFQNQQNGADKATDNGPSMSNLEVSIENDLARLAEADQHLDPVLKTPEQVQALRDGWKAVLQAKEPGPYLAAHATLMRTILTANAKVVDTSGLIVDWDLARFYVIDLAAVKLPQETATTLDLTSRALEVAAGKPLTAEGRVAVQMEQGSIQAMADGLRDDMDNARGFSIPLVARRLGMRLKDHLQTSRAFSQAVSARILGERPMATLSEIRFLGRAAMLNCFSLLEAGLKVQDDLLVERIRATRREQRWAIGGSLVAAALAFYILAALYWSLKGSLATIGNCLAGLKTGDLTRQAQVASRDEIGVLAGELNASVTSLRGLVGGIQDSAQIVLMAAGAIADGSVDLARRTETQAASLEQSAATIEELSVSAGQTGISASRTNEDLQRMSMLMQGCFGAVASATQAMEGFTTFSRNLGRIVEAVEEIAFQANLASVNAMMAASGGDPEKGFGLLASEVHALGKRSAAASDEIKALLKEGTAMVHASAENLTQASGSVKGMEHDLQVVTAFIQNVTIAAKEQAMGINQMSQAMAQLDSLTQRNASMVESGSISAQTLAEQARALANLVAHFRI